MNKQIVRGLVAVGVLAVVGSANAAIETTTLTTAITDYQTAAVAVLGGLTTAVVAIWGVRKLIAFFGSK